MKKGKRPRTVAFWIFFVLAALLLFALFELGKNTLWGWALLLILLIGWVLLRKKSLPETRGELPLWKRRLAVWGSSLAVGVYDGFYGPGTGTFLLLAFCALGKLDVRTASGNVKIANLASNLGALTTSLLAGKVLIGVGLIAACFSIAGHYLGSGLAIKNGSKIVRPVVLTVIVLLTVKILVELIQ